MGENIKINAIATSAASKGPFTYVKNLIMMIRVAHWAKNLFLLIPLFFAGEFFELDKLLMVFLGIASFSLVASSIYILNDIRDQDQDRLHPIKKYRAIASGDISIKTAVIIMMVCLLGGAFIAWICGGKFLLVLGLYLVLNISYSLGLKDISILDIMILAAGFVLRIKAGGIIAHVGISQWLTIMVFLLALFLALTKRRDDILIEEVSGARVRNALSGYNLEFLNVCLCVVSAIMLMAYIMYTLSPEVIKHLGTYRLYYTSIFVFAGLLRYLQLAYNHKDTRSPTRILYRDHFIQFCIVLWIISFYFLLYFKDGYFS